MEDEDEGLSDQERTLHPVSILSGLSIKSAISSLACTAIA